MTECLRSVFFAWAAPAVVLLLAIAPRPLTAQENLVANPSFESAATDVIPDWDGGRAGRVGTVLFLQSENAPGGERCLRMQATRETFTTCSARPIAVEPETDYWITWQFKADQPLSSRTYLFLQTNLAQRVLPHTDRSGNFDWRQNVVKYRTQPGETTLSPVLTMHTTADPPGISWWDNIGVWRRLPPELEAIYRAEHPWDDARCPTAQRLARSESCQIWGDRGESRIGPQSPLPDDATDADAITLTAPGRGHDCYQLVVHATQSLEPLALRFTQPAGNDALLLKSLSHWIVRCVPVREVRNAQVPLGPTPDPLVAAETPEPIEQGQNVVFWIEWAPPAGDAKGEHAVAVEILSGGKPIATVPLRLRRWGFDLPELPHYRSMVMPTPAFITRFYPGMSTEDAYRLAWDLLSRYRLSGFNVAAAPSVTMKDGQPQFDWSRFDRIVEAAKQSRASAITLGPMLGGGCSQGWQPSPLAGLKPLADPAFDALYIEMYRQMAARLRQAGMLDRAYVYPYDEPEPDYMDKIARLCDLIHQGDPELKCLMTVAPQMAEPLWGKIQAWIVPLGTGDPEIIAQRRAAGDEIWIYNMTATLEHSPLHHRLYPWRALAADAPGGLLWNCTWWHEINPWENPTAAPVPVGRNGESLYRYTAGEASLCYPDPAGKGPLVPARRLAMIRQGVEDCDILSELLLAWQEAAAGLPEADRAQLLSDARRALIAPVILGPDALSNSAARTDALRLLAGNALEVARQRPLVIAYPARIRDRLGAVGYAEPGTTLTINGKPVDLDAAGRYAFPLTAEELSAGVTWTASNPSGKKQWNWPPVP